MKSIIPGTKKEFDSHYALIESNNQLILQDDQSIYSAEVIPLIKIFSLIIFSFLLLTVGLISLFSGSILGIIGSICFYLFFIFIFSYCYFHYKNRKIEWEINLTNQSICKKQISPNNNIFWTINSSDVESILISEGEHIGYLKIYIILKNTRYSTYSGINRRVCKTIGVKIAKFLKKPLIIKQEFGYTMRVAPIDVTIFLIASIWTFISGYYPLGIVFLILSLIFSFGFIIWLLTNYKKNKQVRVINNCKDYSIEIPQ